MPHPKTKVKISIKPSEVLEQLRSKSSKSLLSHRQVLDLVPCSRIELYRRVKEGTFPAPIQLGKRNIAWKSTEVFSWLDALPRVSYAPKKAVAK